MNLKRTLGQHPTLAALLTYVKQTFNTNAVELFALLNGTMQPKPVRPHVQANLDAVSNAMNEFNLLLARTNGSPSDNQIRSYLIDVSQYVPHDTR